MRTKNMSYQTKSARKILEKYQSLMAIHQRSNHEGYSQFDATTTMLHLFSGWWAMMGFYQM